MNPFDKRNYRPVSILPLSSKVYERGIYEQASNFFERFFNEILRGFRKALSTQHTLITYLNDQLMVKVVNYSWVCWFFYNGFAKSL